MEKEGNHLTVDVISKEVGIGKGFADAVLCDGLNMKSGYEICSQFIDVERSTTFQKIPEGSELANMVANDAKIVIKVVKLATNLVAKNDANLALPPRFRQVLIESPL
ncbi:hypothetical protein TNCV_2898801 [Trichonephila clavipes]|nr:hypothetical protein TNCV_2898801 [Trichonephila clavipes]